MNMIKYLHTVCGCLSLCFRLVSGKRGRRPDVGCPEGGLRLREGGVLVPVVGAGHSGLHTSL